MNQRRNTSPEEGTAGLVELSAKSTALFAVEGGTRLYVFELEVGGVKSIVFGTDPGEVFKPIDPPPLVSGAFAVARIYEFTPTGSGVAVGGSVVAGTLN